MKMEDVELFQPINWMEGLNERFSALYVEVEPAETKILQAGEERLAEHDEERLETGGADEVLSKSAADQSVPAEDPHGCSE